MGYPRVSCDGRTEVPFRLEIELGESDGGSEESRIEWMLVDRTSHVAVLSSPPGGHRTGGNVVQRAVCLSAVASAAAVDGAPVRYEFLLWSSSSAPSPPPASGAGGGGDDDEDGVGYRLHTRSTVLRGGRAEDIWKVLISGRHSPGDEENRHAFDLESGGGGGRPSTSGPGTVDDRAFSHNRAFRQSNLRPRVSVACPGEGQRKVTIEVYTDNFGSDTSWEFRRKVLNANGDDANGTVSSAFDDAPGETTGSWNGTTAVAGPLVARSERSFEPRETDTREICVDDSALYELRVYDEFGDGELNIHCFPELRPSHESTRFLAIISTLQECAASTGGVTTSSTRTWTTGAS